MENVQEKPFTYDVGVVDEEPIMSQRSGALHAAMEKHPLLENIRGRQKTLTEKEFAEVFPR